MPRVAVHDALRPGAILSGKLRVERVVGQGSMGVVLEAIDVPLQRRVAVKVMAPNRAHNEESRKRFVREARAAARLSSEHVTRLIDVGELDDRTPYLVMEFLEGSTLEHVLRDAGAPPIAVAVDWVLQALDGVAEAHREGLVHRDLKPENLFLCERPDRPPIVKVLDFGTVKDLVSKGTKLTRTGSTMGSPAYMPPEQVRAEEIDARADVWAMGVTLYELITGELPFGGESVPQTLAAILRDPHIPIDRRRPDCPPDLSALVDCALSKDPARRYASANELLAALSVVRARIPSTTRVTRTVRLGQNLQLSRPDAFADTTDLNRLAVQEVMDASQIRPRIVVRDPGTETMVAEPAASPRTRVRFGRLLLALLGAIVAGALVGTLISRLRLSGQARPTASVSAIQTTAPPQAPLPSSPVLAPPTTASATPAPTVPAPKKRTGH